VIIMPVPFNSASPRGMQIASMQAYNRLSTSKNNTMPTQENPREALNSKLKEFFLEQLQDIYWAEKKLVKTLPKLAEAAHSDDLRSAFESHLTETEGHVSRVEQVFSLLGEMAEATECPALKGIVEEGEDIIDETEAGSAQRDVGLIFAGQKAEHYEIATYGALVQLARDMKQDQIADLLSQTLDEEKKADEKLTDLATSGINRQAAQEVAD
jgi:ferritin-like metal-binding protein YciE